MLDTVPLRMGARLKRTSTGDLLDYLKPGLLANSASVIAPDGSIQDILLNDLELIGMA